MLEMQHFPVTYWKAILLAMTTLEMMTSLVTFWLLKALLICLAKTWPARISLMT